MDLPWHTLQMGELFIVDNEPMLVNCEDTGTARLVHELIVITGIVDHCFKAVDRPEVDLDSS